jgi:hypothetical protein
MALAIQALNPESLEIAVQLVKKESKYFQRAEENVQN